MSENLHPALPGLEKPRQRLFGALGSLKKGEPVAPMVLVGPQASGRRMLLREVAAQAKRDNLGVFDLEVLPFGHDTPAHMLLHIAALAPDSTHAKALTDLRAPWNERLAAANALLEVTAARVFLVRFPPGSMPSGERADRQLQQETADIVRIVTQRRPGRLQIVASQPWWRWPHDGDVPERVTLTPSSNSRKFLLDGSHWGSLAATAAQLAKLLGPEGDHVSPLQLRLGVALLAKGTRAAAVRGGLTPGCNLRDLEDPLRRMLERNPALAAALARVARARTAVSPTIMEDIAAAGDDWELVSRCFLYPEADDRLRFHDQLRWLVPEILPETATHRKLRAYYDSMDGTTDPSQGLRNLLPWLEKLHHASRADDKGDVAAWIALNPPTREHYWEYGWSLSYVHRRYAEAAQVYRALLSRIDREDDNYAQHYYAYNLDRAGKDALTVESYYRRAVEGDLTNAWWNARYISFLTQRGRFEAALRAWNAALENIDPGGDRGGGDWLPSNFHKQVIQSALESGDLALADTAHRAIQEPAASLEVFRWLRSQIDAALEVRRLGEALFPAHVSFTEWWKPRLLRARHGETLTRWRAGRVTEVSQTEVAVVLGYLNNDASPTIERQVLKRTTWNKAAHGQLPSEGDFFEVATIGRRLTVESEHPDEGAMDAARLENLLRYLSTPS